MPEAHWAVRACWLAALTLVITSVLVAFQQVAGLSGLVATHASHRALHGALLNRRTRRPDWKTVFVLQVPVQLLSYAIFLYTVGLAVFVFAPMRMAWVAETKVRAGVADGRRARLTQAGRRAVCRGAGALGCAVYGRQPLFAADAREL